MTEHQLSRLRQVALDLTLQSDRVLLLQAYAAAQQLERLRLCPDHRDKAGDECVVCRAERRGRDEAREGERAASAKTNNLARRIALVLTQLQQQHGRALSEIELQDVVHGELQTLLHDVLWDVPAGDVIPWLDQAILDFSGRGAFRPTAHYLLVLRGAAQEINRLRKASGFAELVTRSKSPCGHWSAYAVTADGGAHITCLQCRAEDAEAQLAAIKAPGEMRLTLGEEDDRARP